VACALSALKRFQARSSITGCAFSKSRCRCCDSISGWRLARAICVVSQQNGEKANGCRFRLRQLRQASGSGRGSGRPPTPFGFSQTSYPFRPQQRRIATEITAAGDCAHPTRIPPRPSVDIAALSIHSKPPSSTNRLPCVASKRRINQRPNKARCAHCTMSRISTSELTIFLEPPVS
jgi:hypothetical protein